MSRKPIDKMSPLETREAIWMVIVAIKQFTVTDIYLNTQCSRETIRDYLVGWTAAGYLEKHANNSSYVLIKPVHEPPRVRKDGTIIVQGQVQKNLWRTMKKLGEFTAKDLAIHSRTETLDVAESEAASYCMHLFKAGYLCIIKPGKTTGGKRVYGFIPSKNSGPLAPQIQRTKQIYDQNTKTVVWSAEIKGDDHERK